jgi:hypothetical protein
LPWRFFSPRGTNQPRQGPSLCFWGPLVGAFFEMLGDFFDKHLFGVFELPMQRNVHKRNKTKLRKKRHGIFLIFCKMFSTSNFFQKKKRFLVFLNSTCWEAPGNAIKKPGGGWVLFGWALWIYVGVRFCF